jgi:transcriptional regulator with XRE-family HTH domain
LRVAELRKARAVTQVALARRAGVSVSLLSKIEVGDRVLLDDLRTAVRRYDIPDQAPVLDFAALRADLDQAIALREQAEVGGVAADAARPADWGHHLCAGCGQPAGMGVAGRRVQRRLRPGCAESVDGPR